MQTVAKLSNARRFLTEFSRTLSISKDEFSVAAAIDMLEYYQKNPEEYDALVAKALHL